MSDEEGKANTSSSHDTGSTTSDDHHAMAPPAVEVDSRLVKVLHDSQEFFECYPPARDDGDAEDAVGYAIGAIYDDFRAAVPRLDLFGRCLRWEVLLPGGRTVRPASSDPFGPFPKESEDAGTNSTFQRLGGALRRCLDTQTRTSDDSAPYPERFRFWCTEDVVRQRELMHAFSILDDDMDGALSKREFASLKAAAVSKKKMNGLWEEYSSNGRVYYGKFSAMMDAHPDIWQAECSAFLKPGDWVHICGAPKGLQKGKVRYVGPLRHDASINVGVELEQGIGEHAGFVRGRTYFRCRRPGNAAVFCRVKALVPEARVTWGSAKRMYTIGVCGPADSSVNDQSLCLTEEEHEELSELIGSGAAGRSRVVWKLGEIDFPAHVSTEELTDLKRDLERMKEKSGVAWRVFDFISEAPPGSSIVCQPSMEEGEEEAYNDLTAKA